VCTRFTQAWLPDFSTDPPFDCADDDSSDAAFVHATSLIDGRGTVEQYLACGMFPLSASFGFGEIVEGETSVSKITLPLPEFPLTKVEGECDAHFLARVELSAENVVGSYGRTEHDACVLALPNGGRLNWVFEKAGVAYGLYPEPSTEASKEAVRKRKIDAVVGPVGKWVKIAGKKNVVASKAATAPKGAGAASSKAASMPPKAAPKAGALPKVVAPEATAAKFVPDTTPGTASGAVVTKQEKIVKALSSALALARKVAAPSPPMCGSDDDRVEVCSMLGMVSTTSSSSSSSGETSASESVWASPPPILDLTISSAMIVTGLVLLMIPEMPELEATQYMMEPKETRPHPGTFACTFLNHLLFIFGFESCWLYVFDEADGDVGVTLRQGT
jgi:hypothetical protein